MKKNSVSRAAALLIAAAMLLFARGTAFAADAPDPSAASGTLDALHNGLPPSAPSVPAAAPKDDEPMPPPSFAASARESEAPAKPEPATDAQTLYPSDVRGTEENGVRWIIKTYELGEGETPDGIPAAGFEFDGLRYELTDILKKETAAADTREHTETVTVNTETNDMPAIVKLLEPTLDFISEDGYAGTLALDIATIKVERAGTKTAGRTIEATREYPNLSSNDTSLIPKSISDNGRTLTLTKVDWRAENSETVDYAGLPSSYTAIAAYTATVSQIVVTGYVTAAEYKGPITKLIAGRTIYTAYFMGTPLAPESEAVRGHSPIFRDGAALPSAAGAATGAGLLGGAAFFFFLRKNVRVHNLKDGKYVAVGKARVTARNPVVNLTPFADKAVSGAFVLVLDALAAKALADKIVTVNYGDRSLQHIVEGGGGEYRFEVDF
jgi:hypothetical protein